MSDKDVLEEAHDLKYGDRKNLYGDAVENHERIAKIFNAITERNLSAYEVALMHVATKLVRTKANPNYRDSYVDGAAYLSIANDCIDRAKNKETFAKVRQILANSAQTKT